MSLQYSAYQISASFSQKLKQNSTAVFEVFWAATFLDDFEEFRDYARSEELNLEEIAGDAEAIFLEAKLVLESEDESLSLDFDGKYLENIHLLLSGQGQWQRPDFVVAKDEQHLLINAIIGCHRIEHQDVEAFYSSPSEVIEIAQAFPEILKEDLRERWARLRRKARWDFSSFSEVRDLLTTELIPFYQRAAGENSGMLSMLLP